MVCTVSISNEADSADSDVCGHNRCLIYIYIFFVAVYIFSLPYIYILRCLIHILVAVHIFFVAVYIF